MNDNEIVKALECCASSTTSEACRGCPLEQTDVCIKDANALLKSLLDFINRQEAEIERLRKALEMFSYLNEAVHYVEIGGKVETVEFVSAEAKQKAINKKLDLLCNARKAQSEARKEFAERLKERAEKTTWISGGQLVVKDYKISMVELDTLLAEMEERE